MQIIKKIQGRDFLPFLVTKGSRVLEKKVNEAEVSNNGVRPP